MKRLNRPELLDHPHLDDRTLRGNLRDLARLNRLFGGTEVLLHALRRLVAPLAPGAPVTLLDVGTGSADIPRAIVRWARRQGLNLRITACDAHPQVVDVARAECAGYPEINVAQADVTQLPFAAGSFDFAVCSLLLHHLTKRQVGSALRGLRRTARHGIVVSDLVRGRVPYLGVWLATRLLSRNAITRNDGPLSVQRAFTTGEMRQLAVEAGCPDLMFREVPGFRMIGVGPGCGMDGSQAVTLAGTRRERDLAIQTPTR